MRSAVLLAILLAAGPAAPPVAQRLQSDFICWESDMEFPVDCDEEE